MDIESVKLEISKARLILEKFGREIDPIYFGRFPAGCCGNTSDVLGKWLSSQGVVGLQYVQGTRGQSSHGWLELNGIIIDITSDQFADGCGAVFFSSESAFHRSFKNQRKSVIGMSSILSCAYKNFSDYMKEA
jgi:hypothetical protein